MLFFSRPLIGPQRIGASVERCFVSRMRDLKKKKSHGHFFMLFWFEDPLGRQEHERECLILPLMSKFDVELWIFLTLDPCRPPTTKLTQRIDLQIQNLQPFMREKSRSLSFPALSLGQQAGRHVTHQTIVAALFFKRVSAVIQFCTTGYLLINSTAVQT